MKIDFSSILNFTGGLQNILKKNEKNKYIKKKFA